MSEQMLTYFKQILTTLYQEILNKEKEIAESLMESYKEPDRIDQSVKEEQNNVTVAYQEHEGQLLHEVENALERINNKTYGYCEETGEPIGLKRLLSIPYAPYSLKVQEYKEKQETLRGLS